MNKYTEIELISWVRRWTNKMVKTDSIAQAETEKRCSRMSMCLSVHLQDQGDGYRYTRSDKKNYQDFCCDKGDKVHRVKPLRTD